MTACQHARQRMTCSSFRSLVVCFETKRESREVHRTYIGCTVESRLNAAGQQGGLVMVASVPRICVVALRVVTPKKSCEVNHRARPPVVFTFTIDGDPMYT